MLTLAVAGEVPVDVVDKGRMLHDIPVSVERQSTKGTREQFDSKADRTVNDCI